VRLRGKLHRLTGARFPATRAEALARLEAFLPNAGRAYAARRNFDEGPGPRTTVSALSPAIRRRLLTEEEVARAALAAHGFEAAEKFITEVCWRSYWRGHLETRPALWMRHLSEIEALERRLADEPLLAARYAEAVAGRTGIDAFDFWAGELAQTGWLHNHARMSFASIWVHTLRLPWGLGAAHFYRHLLDACPASNTLSWRWVAGLQTVGKAYLASAEIIRRTSGGRFAVEAPLATSPAPQPPEPAAPPKPHPPPATADSAARTGLFLHTEDLAPESLAWPVAPVALAGPDRIDGDPADLKRAHANRALDDGLDRAARQFGLAPERLPVDALPEAVADWAARHALAQVLTSHAPVGPVADRLADIGAALAARGIRLVPVLRPWDRAAWAHAGRGFFQFRPHIPALLA
jgi:deoxyribodipyrimidine photo-lyase